MRRYLQDDVAVLRREAGGILDEVLEQTLNLGRINLDGQVVRELVIQSKAQRLFRHECLRTVVYLPEEFGGIYLGRLQSSFPGVILLHLPVLNAFKKWLDEQARIVLPKSMLAKAIGYALRQWKALTCYCEDGDLEIDNNAAERALRRIAVGRKNWMFAGNDEGARRAATLYSLIASCHQHGIDPFLYLRDLFRRLPAQPAGALAELTPKAWAQARREAESPGPDEIPLAEIA